jgi:hypothetical protein
MAFDQDIQPQTDSIALITLAATGQVYYTGAGKRQNARQQSRRQRHP